MSNATSSQGVYFGTSDGASPETFEELAEVVSIGGPNESADEIDVTHQRSAGGYREFIQSFKDGGEFSMDLNFVGASISQQNIRSDFASGETKRRRIYYPDGSYSTFLAWVKGVGNTSSVGNKVAMTVNVRVSGPVVLTPASTSPAPA